METIVVLGAGYAGLRAAQRIARDGGKQVQVVVVDAASEFIERIRLHEFAVHGIRERFALAPLLAASGITFVQGRVTGLEHAARQVRLETATGPQQLGYDRQVYALGSRTRSDLVPGIVEHAWTLAPQRIPALHQRLRELPAGAAVVVCGGGLTSIEQAAEIAEALPQLKVTLLSAGVIGAELGARGEATVKGELRRMGVTLIERRPATAITASSVETAAGALPADVCIWNGPMEAASLAREAGLRVNAQGQLLVDGNLRALDDPRIYGAGDAACTVEQPGAPLTMACQVAMPMGDYLGRALLADLRGTALKPFRMNYTLLCASLGRRNGLVQWTNRQRVPTARTWRGWPAMMIKRGIVKYVQQGIKLKQSRAVGRQDALAREV